jgi:hypothetical protein
MKAPQKFFCETVLNYDGDDCLLWPFANVRGYAVRNDGNTTVYVSRELCERRHGPPPSPRHHAAHTCGRGQDGCVAQRHLVWKTPKQNKADELLHGTRNRGSRNGQAKLTEDQVRYVLASSAANVALGRELGVCRETVRDIRRRRLWSWVTVGDAEEPEAIEIIKGIAL